MVFLLGLVAFVICFVIWAYTPEKSVIYLESAYSVKITDYIEISGARLRYKDTGPKTAAAIIMLHGFGASLETWDVWAKTLSATYRVIRLDLPGFGLTGPEPDADYSDQRACGLIAGLMDKLGILRAHIIGNSLGGRIAWNFAVDFPQLVTSLILISPDGFSSPGFEYGNSPKLPIILKLLPYTLPLIMLRMNLSMAYANPKNLTADILARYSDMMRAKGIRKAMLQRMAQVKLQPPEASLRRIIAPTLILWGEQDRMIPLNNAYDFLREIPKAELVQLPSLGHVPFEENPNLSIVPVQKFLDQATL